MKAKLDFENFVRERYSTLRLNFKKLLSTFYLDPERLFHEKNSDVK